MEFKGTKEFKVEYLTTMDFPYKYAVSSIQETDEEAEANALLISKAPEMLDMLNEFIDSLCGEQTCEEELIKGLGNTIYNSVFKAKQLINEATKID
jgi:hypothetical protein